MLTFNLKKEMEKLENKFKTPMLFLTCDNCKSCLPKVHNGAKPPFDYSYYPRECGYGMTHDNKQLCEEYKPYAPEKRRLED